MHRVPENEVSRKKSGEATRQRLIAAARELFLAQGYEATGIAEILRKAEVNSGSLYYFFKTKEDLLLAVLDWYTANLYPEVIDPVTAAVADPIERVFGVLSGYHQLLTMTQCRIGCPIGNLALEMSEKSEAVRAKISLNFENWRKAIRTFLIEAGPSLPANVDRDKLATFILSVMEGGVMLARGHRALEPFESSVALLKDYVDRLLVAGRSGECESDQVKQV